MNSNFPVLSFHCSNWDLTFSSISLSLKTKHFQHPPLCTIPLPLCLHKHTINKTEPVVHTLLFCLSASYKLPLLLQKVLPHQQPYVLLHHSPPFCTMEARTVERKRSLVERVRKSVEEEVENEVEEEDESGASLTEDEKKRGLSSNSGGGRRGSTGGGGGVSPPSCQAERCGADLTDAKRYHRRHKVCELHSKAPAVVVAGLRQRFCQQCSRFVQSTLIHLHHFLLGQNLYCLYHFTIHGSLDPAFLLS